MIPDSPPLRRHPDGATLADRLADLVAERLREAIALRKDASLVVSGGRTPIAFLEALSRRDLPWDRVGVTLADERRVPPQSPDSNQRLVREHLLQGAAAAARFVSLYETQESGAELLRSRQAALAGLAQPFDVLILGMGEDGHTASLFPGAAGLEQALDPASQPGLVLIDPPVAPHGRVSMNLALLLQARWIALHIQGEGKLKVLDQVLHGAPADQFPVAAVLRGAPERTDVHWAP